MPVDVTGLPSTVDGRIPGNRMGAAGIEAVNGLCSVDVGLRAPITGALRLRKDILCTTDRGRTLRMNDRAIVM